MTTNIAPNLTEALIHEPQQSSPSANIEGLGPLQYLVGTWTNQDLLDKAGISTGQGGTAAPYSYCLMPLPQAKSVDKSSGAADGYDADGYILKNFSYYEELTFSPVNGTVPNRGGTVTQVSNTLFYEQRVYFADGPNKGALVHAENGSLLYLTQQQQQPGPYGDGAGDSVNNQVVPAAAANPVNQPFNLVKMMSVPHGNSIMAAGNVSTQADEYMGQGAPVIDMANPVFPDGALTEGDVKTKYSNKGSGNQVPEYTLDPKMPLRQAIDPQYHSKTGQFNRAPNRHIHLQVNTKNSDHPVNNIAFEQKFATVSDYFIDYWLEAFADGKKDKTAPEFTQLQYSQTVILDLLIPGKGKVSFPHILSNTLTKLPPKS